MNVLKVQTDTKWQLIEKFKEKGTKYTPASGTVAIDNNKTKKRKADEISSDTQADVDLSGIKVPSCKEARPCKEAVRYSKVACDCGKRSDS